MRHSFRALGALATLMTALVGCPSKTGTTPGTDGGGAADASVEMDAGIADAGPSPDTCNPDEYFDVATTSCLPAKHCSPSSTDPTGDFSCEYGNNDYCAFGACYCEKDQAGGVCLPRVAPCAPCTKDNECGSSSTYVDYRAVCLGLAGAAGVDNMVCVPKFEGSCPPGYAQGTMSGTFGYCLPAGGACGAAGPCTTDSDCDPTSNSPICDRSQGFCVAACTYKYSDGTSDCPPNQVCHVDPRLLNPPTNPNFGKGRCGAPCDGTGGFTCLPGTSCVADGDPVTSPRDSRCRPPPPSCIRNPDCPPDPASHSYGYCNLSTLTCSTGCQTDQNCTAAYKCVAGTCTQKTCIESGGAAIACSFGQFCCGEAGGPPCPSGVNMGDCYDAPNPPWCGDCTAGQSVATPSGSARPQPSRCALDKMWHSCDPAIQAQCPRSQLCVDGPMFCEQDGDCGSNGKCVDVQFQNYGNKQGKACSCQDNHTCPSPLSRCLMDDMGMPTICVAKWCEMRECYPMMGM